MRTVLALICLGFMVLACSFGNSNNNNNSNNTNNDNSSGSSSSGNFATPKAAVQTFIRAASDRDKNLLSQCFDASSPGEFGRYRDKSASQKDLDGLAEFADGAEVGDARESGNNAMVKVKFKSRDVEMKMKRSDGKWRILDF